MRWKLTLAVIAVLTGTLSPAAFADASQESEFVSYMNSARVSAGLTPFTVDGALVSYARSHTADMIATGSIYHSSSTQLSSITTGWSRVGENVGMGGGVAVINQAFMNSAGHKANILGDFNLIGVGSDVAPDGTIFVTVIFMKKASTPTTTTTSPPTTTMVAPVPAPAPAPAPAPTTTAPTTISDGARSPLPPAAQPEVAAPNTELQAPALCGSDSITGICLD